MYASLHKYMYSQTERGSEPWPCMWFNLMVILEEIMNAFSWAIDCIWHCSRKGSCPTHCCLLFFCRLHIQQLFILQIANIGFPKSPRIYNRCENSEAQLCVDMLMYVFVWMRNETNVFILLPAASHRGKNQKQTTTSYVFLFLWHGKMALNTTIPMCLCCCCYRGTNKSYFSSGAYSLVPKTTTIIIHTQNLWNTVVLQSLCVVVKYNVCFKCL